MSVSKSKSSSKQLTDPASAYKVFISHAAADKTLADAVQDLLETGIGLAHHEVFCTSLEGLGIPEGTSDFKEYIRQVLAGCDTVVALISVNFYASPFCMCELGAVWMVAKNFFPILVLPVDFKDLRGALAGMQCRRLEDPSTASALYTRLCGLVEKPVPIERWDIKKEVFLGKLQKLLDGLSKPQIVALAEFEKLKVERDGYRVIGVQLQEEIDKLKQQNIELAAAKDATAVEAIQKKYSTEWETFEAQLKACRKTVHSLPPVVREALFCWCRGDAFEPDFNQWGEDVKRALEDHLLKEDQHEEYQYWPNEERPKIAEAMKSIGGLKRFLEKECSEEFYTEATKKFGDTPDLERRDFFEHIR